MKCISILRIWFYVTKCFHPPIIVWCCAYYTGESSVEVKTGADSNDITEHPHDDKPRPYLCTVCDKRFTLKDSLKRHKRLHSGVNVYLCSQCEKRFLTQRYLRIHMNVHSKCTECGRYCQSSRDLATHRRSHSGEKPFECSVCSKRFTPVSYTHLTLPTIYSV